MIRDKLFNTSPYEGFDITGFKIDFVEETHEIFAHIIEQARPRLIIEVGTWKGGSALHMARICKEKGLKTEIVCIDTWLGSYEHWMLKDPRWGKQNLGLVNGYPTIYRQFLANVILSGHTDTITPLPLSSVNGAILLKKLGVKADIAYIDAAHDFRSVITDFAEFWDLVRPGGALIGDDYHAGGPEVVKAANEFATFAKVPLHISHPKCLLVKPTPTQPKPSPTQPQPPAPPAPPSLSSL